MALAVSFSPGVMSWWRTERRLFAALIDLSSAPRQAQIAVICVPRLASAEQQRSAHQAI
jgi:hypothetical protein